MNLRDRSTVDLVVLGLLVVVALVVVAGFVGIILIELIHPEVDTDPLIRIESEILGVLVGALVGFVGGRGVGRAEEIDSILERGDVAEDEA
jgi:hypothetical protein